MASSGLISCAEENAPGLGEKESTVTASADAAETSGANTSGPTANAAKVNAAKEKQVDSVRVESTAAAPGTPQSMVRRGALAPKIAVGAALHQRLRPISTETVAVTLGAVPAHLQQKTLSDPAWRQWLQGALGEQVKVLSARQLDPTKLGVPAKGTQVVVQVEGTTESNIQGARERAAQTQGIARAEVDPIWSSNAVPNDPEYGKQWHLPKISAPAAWDIATGSPSVVVAVIDTGIDLSHPDLAGAIWTNPAEAADGVDNDLNGLVDDVHGWNFLGNNANLADSTGHGTHVAGLIGAVKNNAVGVAGVASGVKIMPLAVGEYAPASAVASAIYYAVANGAHIINMSFGGPDTFSGARAAIDYAVAHGVLLVSSANNKSSDEYNYPAVYQDVLAVAATDPEDKRASLSSYGSWVDIAAPGQAVVSTFKGGGYLAVSGTSQASPIVAGVAALIKSVHLDWTAEQIRTQLMASADDLSATNPDYVGLLGAGRVNAARAVGPTLTTARPFLAGVTSSELTGNGDQHVGPGETASVLVSWRFTGNASAATARLVSSDPYVTVTSGPVTLGAPRADRTQSARFTISIAANTPADRRANLTAAVDSAGTTISSAIQLSVAPAMRKLSLPFAYGESLLPHPSGQQFFVADDSPLDGPRHRIYAAFRNSDGSFTPETTLSDTTNNARRPNAFIDPNGDVHVVYYQAVQSQEFAAFPGYSKYTAATGEWTRTILTSGRGVWSHIDAGTAGAPQPVAISRSPNGELHIAWTALDGLVLTKQVGEDWSEQQFIPYSSESSVYPQLDLKFITVDGGLKLFVHPVPTRGTTNGPPPDYTRKAQVLEYDGVSWSQPVELNAGTATENAKMPYLSGNEVRRFFAPPGGSQVSVARLTGVNWETIRPVQDIGNVDLQSGFFGLEASTGDITFLARPVAATGGSAREIWQSGALRRLDGDSKLAARYPLLLEQGGNLLVFNQERWIHREHESWSEFAEETSFYSPNPLAASARPTAPVVTDDGATTTDNRHLHARWTSSHSSGIREYRVAWGTAPGLDDIVPWAVTALTENTWDLGEQRLLSGQTAYLSVIAHSNSVLSSAMGASDGITMANLCVDSPWNSSITYQQANLRVTYQGATYRSLYWNSNSAPTTPNGAWQFVSNCVGTPVLPTCRQPQWVAGRMYPAGARVSYNGFEFVAQWASNVTPTGTSGNPWQWITSCQ